MTKKLAQDLISHYEMAINEVENSAVADIREKLKELSVGCGICMCAEEIFGVHIYEDVWVKSLIFEDKCWWYRIPYNCVDELDESEKKRAVLDSLNFRLNKLKSFSDEKN